MSKGITNMQKIVIKKPWGVEIKDYKAGDPIPAGVKFKIFDAKDTAKIDAYADSLDESATYQKKRFLEPYYMYNESVKTIKESSETKKDYLKYIDEFEKDVKKYIDWMKKDVKENKEVPLPEAIINLATAITNAMNRYNNAVKTKTLTEGFMVKEKLGNTYIGRFDSKDKAEKAVKDLAKRQGKSESDWLVEPDDKYMAAATAKGASSWGPIPMNTLTESFIIQDSDSNNKPVYFHYGKYTGYDWGFDKNAATKFSTLQAAEQMIEKMRQEGVITSDMKVIKEGRIAKGYENLDAEEKARHLLSHPSSKYMNDLKSENITERAIRKAVKEMLGKPDKRDPQFIIDVNEEGEAPAIANTTAEVANPDLPLKLKESNSWTMGDGTKMEVKGDKVFMTTPEGKKFWMSKVAWEHLDDDDGDIENGPSIRKPYWIPAKEDLESDKAEALADYKKAKAEYLANKSDENWKKFSAAKSKCMQLGCRI